MLCRLDVFHSKSETTIRMLHSALMAKKTPARAPLLWQQQQLAAEPRAPSQELIRAPLGLRECKCLLSLANKLPSPLSSPMVCIIPIESPSHSKLDGQYILQVNSWTGVGVAPSSFIASFVSDSPCGSAIASTQPLLAQGASVVVVIGGSGSSCGLLDLSLVLSPSWKPHVWVSAVGSDTTGTGKMGAPFQTLAKALPLAPANGVVVIRNGTYTLSSGLAVTNSVTVTSGACLFPDNFFFPLFLKLCLTHAQSEYPEATVAHMAEYGYDSFNTWRHPDEIGTAFDTGSFSRPADRIISFGLCFSFAMRRKLQSFQLGSGCDLHFRECLKLCFFPSSSSYVTSSV